MWFKRNKLKVGLRVRLLNDVAMSYGEYKKGTCGIIQSMGYRWEKYPILIKVDNWESNGQHIPYGNTGNSIRVMVSEIEII